MINILLYQAHSPELLIQLNHNGARTTTNEYHWLFSSYCMREYSTRHLLQSLYHEKPMIQIYLMKIQTANQLEMLFQLNLFF